MHARTAPEPPLTRLRPVRVLQARFEHYKPPPPGDTEALSKSMAELAALSPSALRHYDGAPLAYHATGVPRVVAPSAPAAPYVGWPDRVPAAAFPAAVPAQGGGVMGAGQRALPGTELMQTQADLMLDFLQSQTEQAGRSGRSGGRAASAAQQRSPPRPQLSPQHAPLLSPQSADKLARVAAQCLRTDGIGLSSDFYGDAHAAAAPLPERAQGGGRSPMQQRAKACGAVWGPGPGPPSFSCTPRGGGGGGGGGGGAAETSSLIGSLPAGGHLVGGALEDAAWPSASSRHSLEAALEAARDVCGGVLPSAPSSLRLPPSQPSFSQASRPARKAPPAADSLASPRVMPSLNDDDDDDPPWRPAHGATAARVAAAADAAAAAAAAARRGASPSHSPCRSPCSPPHEAWPSSPPPRSSGASPPRVPMTHAAEWGSLQPRQSFSPTSPTSPQPGLRDLSPEWGAGPLGAAGRLCDAMPHDTTPRSLGGGSGSASGGGGGVPGSAGWLAAGPGFSPVGFLPPPLPPDGRPGWHDAPDERHAAAHPDAYMWGGGAAQAHRRRRAAMVTTAEFREVTAARSERRSMEPGMLQLSGGAAVRTSADAARRDARAALRQHSVLP